MCSSMIMLARTKTKLMQHRHNGSTKFNSKPFLPVVHRRLIVFCFSLAPKRIRRSGFPEDEEYGELDLSDSATTRLDPSPLDNDSSSVPGPSSTPTGPLIQLSGFNPPEEAIKVPPIHDELLPRWKSIASSGLADADLQSLIFKFLCPEKAQFISPLTLNS